MNIWLLHFNKFNPQISKLLSINCRGFLMKPLFNFKLLLDSLHIYWLYYYKLEIKPSNG